MNKMHIKRLTKLANFINEISNEIWYFPPQRIVFLDEEKQIGYEVMYLRWVFSEMPYLFDDWHCKEDESKFFEETSQQWIFIQDHVTHMMASEHRGTVWSALLFFGLEAEEFLHLFGIGFGLQQPGKYGGTIYKSANDVTGRDIANNIYELIKTKTDGR